MNLPINLFIYILSGAALGSLMLLSGIPAAPLLGSILAAGCLSISGQFEPAQWPLGTKTLLGIGVGTVIGTGINKDTLAELQTLWKPAILITITLILTGLAVGFLVVRLFGIDPLIPKGVYFNYYDYNQFLEPDVKETWYWNTCMLRGSLSGK